MKLFYFLTTVIWFASVIVSSGCSRPAESTSGRMVRIAEIEVDPAQLDKYKTERKEEIDTSIRIEPGVIALYAVSLKDDPAKIRIFETYADVDAYKAHIDSPHFQKYKVATQDMVKSLKLVETDAIALGAR